MGGKNPPDVIMLLSEVSVLLGRFAIALMKSFGIRQCWYTVQIPPIFFVESRRQSFRTMSDKQEFFLENLQIQKEYLQTL